MHTSECMLAVQSVTSHSGAHVADLSAFSKTWLSPELRQLSCESPAVFLRFPLEEKGPWNPFYQLRQVLAKGRHLLQTY